MANTDTPNGLRLVGSLGVGPMAGATQIAFIPATDATATFVGDPVKVAGSADADGVPTVAQAAATNAIYGVITEFLPDLDNKTRLHRAASTARYCKVCIDPNALYEIQEDSDGAALAATDVGNNASIVVGTGSTTTGASAVELDSSTAATTAALELKIIRLANRPDNAIGTNAKWIVKINNHQLGSHTGTAGV